MGFLSWLLLGLLVGVLAKWIMPGPDSSGLVMTIVLGVAGAFLGGWVGTQLGFGSVTGFDLRSLGIAVAGALGLLFANRKLRGRGA
jgi:uncharacterized membrane protein YeaQ/YmgE (transglycosylase-associated protein family)